MRFIKYMHNNVGLCFVIGVLLCCTFPYLFTREAWINCLILSNDGKRIEGIGDTIGGIMGPFIGILGAWLTYLVFKSQVDFQKKQDFDSKFYPLLEFHRHHVNNLSVYKNKQDNFSKITGTDCFHEMCKELELLYTLWRNFRKYKNISIKNDEFKTDKAVAQPKELLFDIFYFGIGDLIIHRDSKALDGYNDEYKDTKEQFYALLLIIKEYKFSKIDIHQTNLYSLKYYTELRLEGQAKNELITLYNQLDIKELSCYKDIVDSPNVFNGNINNLTNIFVTLFTILNLIETDITEHPKKNSYYSILRSQISSYELLLIKIFTDTHLGSSLNDITRKQHQSDTPEHKNESYTYRANLFEYMPPEFTHLYDKLNKDLID